MWRSDAWAETLTGTGSFLTLYMSTAISCRRLKLYSVGRLARPKSFTYGISILLLLPVLMRVKQAKPFGYSEQLLILQKTLMSTGSQKREFYKISFSPVFTSRMFISHRRSENSPAKFLSFPERALLLHNNSPVTLQYLPATTILNEIPDFIS